MISIVLDSGKQSGDLKEQRRNKPLEGSQSATAPFVAGFKLHENTCVTTLRLTRRCLVHVEATCSLPEDEIIMSLGSSISDGEGH